MKDKVGGKQQRFKSTTEAMGDRSPYAKRKAPTARSRQAKIGLGETAEDRKTIRDALAFYEKYGVLGKKNRNYPR